MIRFAGVLCTRGNVQYIMWTVPWNGVYLSTVQKATVSTYCSPQAATQSLFFDNDFPDRDCLKKLSVYIYVFVYLTGTFRVLLLNVLCTSLSSNDRSRQDATMAAHASELNSAARTGCARLNYPTVVRDPKKYR